MKKLIAAVILALALTPKARAVSIEGQDQNGDVSAVGVVVSSSGVGYLDVSLSSLTVAGSVTLAGPLPLPTYLVGSSSNPITIINTNAQAVPVSLTSGSFSVQFPTTTTTGTSQGSQVGAASGFTVLPANGSSYNTVITNTCGTPAASCGAIIYVGSSTVTSATGFPILPGASYSPDNPASFQGQLYGASTATVSWAWIRH